MDSMDEVIVCPEHGIILISITAMFQLMSAGHICCFKRGISTVIPVMALVNIYSVYMRYPMSYPAGDGCGSTSKNRCTARNVYY